MVQKQKPTLRKNGRVGCLMFAFLFHEDTRLERITDSGIGICLPFGNAEPVDRPFHLTL